MHNICMFSRTMHHKGRLAWIFPVDLVAWRLVAFGREVLI